MLTLRTGLAAVLTPVAALAAGCLGDAEILKPRPRDIAADAIGAVVCEGAATCCRETGRDVPGEDCVTAVRNVVMRLIIEAEDDGREVRAEAIDACVESFEAAIDSAPACTFLPGPAQVPTLCPGLFTAIAEGPRLPGEVCSGTDDCASPPEAGSRECALTGDGDGTCIWRLERMTGAPCADDPGIVSSCAVGLTCVPSATGPTCGPHPGSGGACLPGPQACREGLACVAGEGLSYTCKVSAGASGKCLGPASCPMGTFCDAGTCRAANGTCAGSVCPTIELESVCR